MTATRASTPKNAAAAHEVLASPELKAQLVFFSPHNCLFTFFCVILALDDTGRQGLYKEEVAVRQSSAETSLTSDGTRKRKV